jgi:hypothetical protein
MPSTGNDLFTALKKAVSLVFNNKQTPWLLEKPSAAQLLRKFPHFVEHEVSLPCSQDEPCSCLEPDETSPYHPISSQDLFFKITKFNLSHYVYSRRVWNPPSLQPNWY